MRLLLLLFLLGVLTAINAQPPYYYSQVVKPVAGYELPVAVYDSVTQAYFYALTHSRPKKAAPLPVLDIFSSDNYYHTICPKDGIKHSPAGLTNEHEIIGMWSNDLTQLKVLGFSNLYEHDSTLSVPYTKDLSNKKDFKVIVTTNGNRFLQNTIRLTDYDRLLPVDIYQKIQDLVIEDISKDLGLIKHNALLLSQISLKPDTTVLPHIYLDDFSSDLFNVLTQNEDTIYSDMTLANPLAKDDSYWRFVQADTHSFVDPVDPAIIRDTIVVSYRVEKIFITYRWDIAIATNSQYPYLDTKYLTFTRKPYSIGILTGTGEVAYKPYADIIKYLNYWKQPVNGFTECFEMVFYNSLKKELPRQVRVWK